MALGCLLARWLSLFARLRVLRHMVSFFFGLILVVLSKRNIPMLTLGSEVIWRDVFVYMLTIPLVACFAMDGWLQWYEMAILIGVYLLIVIYAIVVDCRNKPAETDPNLQQDEEENESLVPQ
jgi:Ca2+/Na+ antiporter